MTRLYGDPVLVALHDDQLQCFIWRGTTYRVQEVLATWHLRDRWWDHPSRGAATASAAAETDRYYYRLECSPELQCELYFDSTSAGWVLDRVYD